MIHYLADLMIARTKSGQLEPRIIVFLDDLLNLLARVDVAKPLGELASLGRGAGINLVIATQRLGEKGSGGGIVTGNIPTRLVFGAADGQDAAMFTGRGGSGAECLGRYPGDALLVTDGGVQRLAVGYVTATHLTALKQDPQEWRPWLQRSSAPPSQAAVAPVMTSTMHSPEAQHEGSAQVDKLPDVEPDVEARAKLRRIYEATGSKNETLRRVWGGVINESGKSPKTKRWLDQAIAEVVT
jgi:hypothetical protein